MESFYTMGNCSIDSHVPICHVDGHFIGYDSDKDSQPSDSALKGHELLVVTGDLFQTLI